MNTTPEHKQLKKGDLVRYGIGATALMIMETDRGDGLWSGPQCVGGQVTNPLSVLVPTGFKDRRAWVMHAAFRKQTTDEAMAQIGYVIGEESLLEKFETLSDANAHAQQAFIKRFSDQVTTIDTPEGLLAKAKLEMDSFDAICRKKFVDTPEAKREPLSQTSSAIVDITPKELIILLAITVSVGILIGAGGAIIGMAAAKLI